MLAQSSGFEFDSHSFVIGFAVYGWVPWSPVIRYNASQCEHLAAESEKLVSSVLLHPCSAVRCGIVSLEGYGFREIGENREIDSVTLLDSFLQ